ncbi:unnamed protein product [Enterobius vermicularis]|uniref:Vitellogenin domain-containing protein n=1 Tax=Enterobius vermicularis TaxID=51028 RepID=A0A0N4VDV9_ENTVE|nr:unnamed protein product [Enterobius vermicularis]
MKWNYKKAMDTNSVVTECEIQGSFDYDVRRYPVAEIESNYVERIKIDPTNAMKQTVRAKGKLDSFYKAIIRYSIVSKLSTHESSCVQKSEDFEPCNGCAPPCRFSTLSMIVSIIKVLALVSNNVGFE